MGRISRHTGAFRVVARVTLTVTVVTLVTWERHREAQAAMGSGDGGDGGDAYLADRSTRMSRFPPCLRMSKPTSIPVARRLGARRRRLFESDRALFGHTFSF